MAGKRLITGDISIGEPIEPLTIERVVDYETYFWVLILLAMHNKPKIIAIKWKANAPHS